MRLNKKEILKRNDINKSISGITLIALVITIVVLIILAGVGMSLSIGSNGVYTKAQSARERTKYAAAKEEINLKIIEIITEKVSKGETCKLSDIASKIKESESITIEKYYNSDVGLIKEGITENLDTLKGIIVSSNKYSKYKFLIGKSCRIEGVLVEITDETEITDFVEINEFEESIFGDKVTTSVENPDNNIRKWLNEAELGKTYAYTTIEEVLNDNVCLELLMKSPDAYNFFLNTTEIKEEVLKSTNAKNAIIAAGITTKVPILESNDNIIYGDLRGGYEPYFAFDNNKSTSWITNDFNYNSYIGYNFNENTLIYGLSMINSDNYETDAILEGANEGEDWEKIDDIKFSLSAQEYSKEINCTKTYKMYRIKFNSKNGYLYDVVAELQFNCILLKEQPESIKWNKWAEKAGINSKNYTSIQELLNDDTAVEKLIASEEATQYIANCDESMQDIIFSSEKIRNELCNNMNSVKILFSSPIWSEDILNNNEIMNEIEENTVTVPTLTNNTTDIIYENERSGYPLYYAFDNNPDTSWISPDWQNTTYLGYDFKTDLTIYKIALQSPYGGGCTNHVNAVVQGSNDTTNWENIQNLDYDIESNDIKYISINSKKTYKRYRIKFNASNAYYLYNQLMTLQFYCF